MDVTLITNLFGAIGLGAASGLNAWIPLFCLGLAQRIGLVELSQPFDSLGSTPVLVVLGALLVLDLIGDKIPVIDHVLHAVGVVIAPASGAVVVLAQENLLTHVHPALAALTGMVLGGTIHAGRSAVRPAVTAGTAGVGNPVVSIVEDVISAMLTALAIIVPVLAFLFVVALVVGGVVVFRRWRRRRASRRDGASGAPVAPAPSAWQRGASRRSV